MSGKTAKILLIILAVLIILFIASELLIPRVASTYLEREVRKKFPSSGKVSVSVDAFPALRLLFKQYSKLRVTAEEITIEGVNFDSIDLRSTSYPDATFEATIGQDEINRFFSLGGSYLLSPRISLKQDYLLVRGTMKLAGETATVSATGDLEARGGVEIYFKPEKVEVAGYPVSGPTGELIRATMNERPLFTVRENLPFIISDIVSREGKLIIEGNVDLEQALNLKL